MTVTFDENCLLCIDHSVVCEIMTMLVSLNPVMATLEHSLMRDPELEEAEDPFYKEHYPSKMSL